LQLLENQNQLLLKLNLLAAKKRTQNLHYQDKRY